MSKKKQLSIYAFVLMGALLGALFDLFYQYKIIYIYPYLCLITFGLFFSIAYNGRHKLRLLTTSLITSAIVCSPLLFLSSKTPYSQWLIFYTLMPGFPFLIYAVHSFHYAFHYEGKAKMSYLSLFYAVWNTIPILLLATIFLSFANLLILLMNIIFSTLGYEAAANFLSTNLHFKFLSNSILFFVGIGVAKQNIKIVNSLRYVLLQMIYYLLPLLAIITIGYFFLYLFSQQTSDYAIAMNKAIMLSLLTLGVIFFNAIFQTGEEQVTYNKVIVYLLKLYRIILFILCLQLVYAMAQVVKQHLNLMVYFTVALSLTSIYAITVLLNKEKESNWIKYVNVKSAQFFIISILILNNPFMALDNQKYHRMPAQSLHSVYPMRRFDIATQLKRQQQTLKSIGGAWVEQGISAQDATAICRVEFNNGYQIGVIENDACKITYAGKVIVVKNYHYLSIPKASIEWQKPGLVRGLALGAEINRVLSACRVEIDSKLYIGKTVSGRCNIAYNGKERAMPVYQILTISNAEREKSMEDKVDDKLSDLGYEWQPSNSDDYFIAATTSEGNIGICRTQYKQGLQIGIYTDEQCIITYAGKAFAVDNFELLSAMPEATPTWQKRNFKNQLVVGFEFIANDRVRNLYACRGIVNNQIHIGKVVAGKCNYAQEDKELQMQWNDFDILSTK